MKNWEIDEDSRWERYERERKYKTFWQTIGKKCVLHSLTTLNGNLTARFLHRQAVFLQIGRNVDDINLWPFSEREPVRPDIDGVVTEAGTPGFTQLVKELNSPHKFICQNGTGNLHSAETSLSQIEESDIVLKKLHSPIPILHLLLPNFYASGTSEQVITLRDAYPDEWRGVFGDSIGYESGNALSSHGMRITHMSRFLYGPTHATAAVVSSDTANFLVSPINHDMRLDDFRVIQVS